LVAYRLQYRLHVNASISDNGRITKNSWTSEILWMSLPLLAPIITMNEANMNVIISTSNRIDFTEEICYYY